MVNESTIYGGSAEYHCIPGFNRIGQYLRKCTDDGTWSGDEPRCELVATEAQESSGLGSGIAIGATIIIALLILIGLIFIHRNKARPVKNTENVQAAESKDERNAAVMSYSTLEANNRMNLDNGPPATFNTFHGTNGRRANNGNATKGEHFEFHFLSNLIKISFICMQKTFTIKYPMSNSTMHPMKCVTTMRSMNPSPQRAMLLQ